MKIIFHAAFLVLSLILGACARQDEKIIKVGKDDAEMNSAIAEARRTLSDFWAKREKDGTEFNGLLKVYFFDAGDADTGEHMWVKVTKKEDGEISGVLLGAPAWLKSVKEGEAVRFPEARISDWLYVKDLRAHGAYTEKLLRKRMTPAERKEHDEAYPFTFE